MRSLLVITAVAVGSLLGIVPVAGAGDEPAPPPNVTFELTPAPAPAPAPVANPSFTS